MLLFLLVVNIGKLDHLILLTWDPFFKTGDFIWFNLTVKGGGPGSVGRRGQEEASRQGKGSPMGLGSPAPWWQGGNLQPQAEDR